MANGLISRAGCMPSAKNKKKKKKNIRKNEKILAAKKPTPSPATKKKLYYRTSSDKERKNWNAKRPPIQLQNEERKIGKSGHLARGV